jgi:hypothetical protein
MKISFAHGYFPFVLIVSFCRIFNLHWHPFFSFECQNFILKTILLESKRSYVYATSNLADVMVSMMVWKLFPVVFTERCLHSLL